MGILEMLISLGSLLTLVISIAAFLRQNKIDAADYATKIAKVENEVSALKEKVNTVGYTDVPKLQSTVDNLTEKIHKLDNDLESKIDKVAENMIELSDRINKLLIKLAKSNIDV